VVLILFSFPNQATSLGLSSFKRKLYIQNHTSSSHAFVTNTLVMPLRWPGYCLGACSYSVYHRARWILFAATTIWLGIASAMTTTRIAELRQETVDMFYHGFDNYMSIAFPEDEVGISYRMYKLFADTNVATSSVLCTFNPRRSKSTTCRTE
jgi:hypothetical protein